MTGWDLRRDMIHCSVYSMVCNIRSLVGTDRTRFMLIRCLYRVFIHRALCNVHNQFLYLWSYQSIYPTVRAVYCMIDSLTFTVIRRARIFSATGNENFSCKIFHNSEGLVSLRSSRLWLLRRGSKETIILVCHIVLIRLCIRHSSK